MDDFELNLARSIYFESFGVFGTTGFTKNTIKFKDG